jgi:rhamnose utilization protein RhaD (predicted bifunctional aldolase and dehydrogenase)
MLSAYSESHAKDFIKHYAGVTEELFRRTYTSRLMDADPHLVLHGGGNTSLKLKQKNVLGE